MKTRGCVFVMISALVMLPAVAGMSKKERQELEAEIKALDKDKIHTLVVTVEEDPLGEGADIIRPALVIYFEDIHYDVCLDQLGPLVESKKKAHRAVFWQVVFSSGDYFIQHPDQSADRVAYMLAGLEGALRAYERILQQQPKSRLEFLDNLVAKRIEGRLMEHIRANPCAKE